MNNTPPTDPMPLWQSPGRRAPRSPATEAGNGFDDALIAHDEREVGLLQGHTGDAASTAATAVESTPSDRTGLGPVASLSLDLDNKWSYLKTHGDPGWESFPSYLELVVPHVLQILASIDVRITVFVVGQDAGFSKNAAALQSLVEAGHEIGNHSFHHEPWLQNYSRDQIESELADAEQAIFEVTGTVPKGFRGPGFSFSPLLLETLLRRGYSYDASTFPTFLGPVARAYYFLSTRLDERKREERKNLFGRFADGFRPLKPYYWRSADAQAGELLEIPVTTIPGVRTPFHLSYLLYLASFSERLAWSYWRYALISCRLARIAPSLLLHPLDFVGGDEVADLDFFPAMSMPGARKRAFARRVLKDYCKKFQVRTMAQHAEIIRRTKRIPAREISAIPKNIVRPNSGSGVARQTSEQCGSGVLRRTTQPD